MKAAEPKTVTSSANRNTPFFSKSGEHNFFDVSTNEHSFFAKSQNKNSPIQTKLTIGQPNDKYEKEADAMADKVVQRLSDNKPGVTNKTETLLQTKPIVPLAHTITPFVQTKCASCEQEEKLQKKEEVDDKYLMNDKLQMKPIFEGNGEPPEDSNNIQRKCAECEKEKKLQPKTDVLNSPTPSSKIESSLASSKGGGFAIPFSTREQMENSFGADFSDVRLHTDSTAVQMNKELNAQAFAHGNDIYFNSGKYDTNNNGGKHLLAHELTHTVQQRSGLRFKLSTAKPASNFKGYEVSTYPTANDYLQRQSSSTKPKTAAEVIDEHTTLGFLREKKLGEYLAAELPAATQLINDVLDKVHDTNKDDISYETTKALGPNLKNVPVSLRIRFVNEMVYGIVTDDEESEIANIWISFGEPTMPFIAEENRPLWKKSLWESDELVTFVKPQVDAFKADVIGLAREYLTQNRQSIDSEAERYGINLDDPERASTPKTDYLESVRQIVPGILILKKKLDELRQIKVGYHEISDCLAGECIAPSFFNPEIKPSMPPKKTESPQWPTWEDVKSQHDRGSALISGFANIYPSIYILIQQDKLETLTQSGDAAKALKVIAEALGKTREKIIEGTAYLGGRITPYDLKMIQNQLFSDSKAINYEPRYSWDKPFYHDIASDDLKGHNEYEFWVDMGLSLIAAAAIIAAPFTGGATAAFLVGFGVGAGAAQAGMSWEKYLAMSTIGEASVKEELTLISKGEINAKLVEAIVNTLSVFLDVYGIKAATAAGKTAKALEAAEKGLKEELAETARKRMVREGLKDAAVNVAGAGLGVGLHELEEEEPDYHFDATVSGRSIELGPETHDDSQTPSLSPKLIQRSGAPPKKPIRMTGDEFEISASQALLKESHGGVPKMDFVLPGQYKSNWGIDRIGIVWDEATGRINLYHFEMKWVSEGSPHIPGLGSSKHGAQTSESWTINAIDGFMNSNHPKARAGKERLRRALKKIYPNKDINTIMMRKFLQDELPYAKVIVVVPDWAKLTKLHKQVAALIRHGREISIVKLMKK